MVRFERSTHRTNRTLKGMFQSFELVAVEQQRETEKRAAKEEGFSWLQFSIQNCRHQI
jgi:hypothetical protein